MAHSRDQADETPSSKNCRWVFVGPASPADAERCTRFGVPIVDAAATEQWSLRRADSGLLELSAPAADGSLSVDLDLRSGQLARRLQTARRDQPLPRAIGLHRRTHAPTVVDATAGLGRDALLLARLGCHVEACERIPVLAMLVDDAAERANVGERLIVHCIDASAELERRGAAAVDVVYLDPMFPDHGRAQVKKEMQVCRMLAGMPESATLLMHRAKIAARDRVVVKRHPQELPLAGAPSFTVAGERVRFDIYLCSNSGNTPSQ